MNELKTEDVIRALECCIEVDCGSIAICPRRENYKNEYICSANLKKDALALLREKDFNIKMLDEDRLGWADEAVKVKIQLNGKDAEIERLNKERDDARSDCAVAEQNHYKCKKELETARAEAIAEFAEKLKEAVKYIPWCDYPPVIRCIDEIAEKMKGETDGKTDL